MMIKASCPDCPLLDHANEILRDGKRFKEAADRCLAGHGACEVTMEDVTVWLKDVAATTKALRAFAKRG